MHKTTKTRIDERALAAVITALDDRSWTIDLLSKRPDPFLLASALTRRFGVVADYSRRGLSDGEITENVIEVSSALEQMALDVHTPGSKATFYRLAAEVKHFFGVYDGCRELYHKASLNYGLSNNGEGSRAMLERMRHIVVPAKADVIAELIKAARDTLTREGVL